MCAPFRANGPAIYLAQPEGLGVVSKCSLGPKVRPFVLQVSTANQTAGPLVLHIHWSNQPFSPERTADALQCFHVVLSGLCVWFIYIPRTCVRGYCLPSLRDYVKSATSKLARRVRISANLNLIDFGFAGYYLTKNEPTSINKPMAANPNNPKATYLRISPCLLLLIDCG